MVRADGAHVVAIRTQDHLPAGDDGCTADLTPTTSTVRLPSQTMVTMPVRIAVDGVVTTLEPRSTL
jgi:hypothetical protein